jgi:peptidoglycan/xylan/chitin deacetylase (PgdA/CDA1 family)
MRIGVKELAKRTLYAVGYYGAFGAVRTPRERRLLVLMYHDILDEERAADPRELDDDSPSAAEFESHLRVIREHYAILPLGEAFDRLRRGALDRNTVAITFDDGYESVYGTAFPLLRQFDAPATVFLLTGWIGNGTPYWWPRLRSLLQHSDFRGISQKQLSEIAGTVCRAYDGQPPGLDARKRLAREIESSFRDLRDDDRSRRLASLERLLFPDRAPPSPPRALTWEQVREMSHRGVDFEPHTRSHINIGAESHATVREEVASSRRDVEEQTSRRPQGFAYPYGKEVASYRAVGPILAEMGFSYAITAVNGVNSPRTSPFLLWRMSLPKTRSHALIHRALILAFAGHREDGSTAP